MFIDTYIASNNQDCLRRFCDAYPNAIGPRQGRDAVPEQTFEDGSFMEAQTAAGDPLKWYACIRSSEALTLSEGIEVCSKTEGIAVLGIWA